MRQAESKESSTKSAKAAPVVVALLEGLFDYAGLFPPAQLKMSEAVQQYALYRDSEEAWILGKFVLPAARLQEFASLAVPLALSSRPPWALSVLSSDWGKDQPAIDRLVNEHPTMFTVVSIETRYGKPGPEPAFDDAAVYVELPITASLPSQIEVSRSMGRQVKIRTGGLEASAFPSTEKVLRFLAIAAEHEVGSKATAGLHHPFPAPRRAHAGEGAAVVPMHGFVNVILAATLLRKRIGSREDLVALLEETDGDRFEIRGEELVWRHFSVSAEDIRQGRSRLLHSIGSCSFEEPIQDLHWLGWL